MAIFTGRRSTLFAAAVLAAALALAVSGSTASAQSAPRPPGTCRGTLTLGTVFRGVELSYTATGLEANAAYTIFIGGQAVASATTTGAGTTGGSITVPAGTPAGAEVQVTTANSCASGTLLRPVFATFIPQAIVTVGGVTVVITRSPFATPVRTCIVPGTFVVVAC